MSLFGHALAVAAKDLKVEARSREIVYTMAFFAAMVVLLFSFAFKDSAAEASVVISGLLWISVIFAGTLGLSRAFDRERENDTMRGLLMAPIPRTAIFLGKAASIAVFMLVVEAVVVPMAALLFAVDVFGRPLELLGIVTLATIGVSVVGATFAAMLLRTRARDVLLPVVLYPILVPLFMAATFGTMAILPPEIDLETAHFWLKFLLVYDALFVAASLWIFESLVIE
ncbi:MAG: heme exporter protein CcmB [Deltaproteobacteria bacterium]|nr:heme exporter protein CcmB [Deltaproteobacteria bacterium]